MRYFVVAEDGSKYGPADVNLLNEWIDEGRLHPGMNLEEEGTHVKVAAASVLGLDFMPREERKEEPAPARTAPVDGAGAMALLSDQPVVDSGKVDVGLALAMAIVTVVLGAVPSNVGILGLFTGLLALVAGFKAKDRRHPAATVAVAVAVLGVAIWVILRLVVGRR
jgi:hypothetical protein